MGDPGSVSELCWPFEPEPRGMADVCPREVAVELPVVRRAKARLCVSISSIGFVLVLGSEAGMGV